MVNCDFTNHMGGKSVWGGNLFSSGEGGAPEVFFLKVKMISTHIDFSNTKNVLNDYVSDHISLSFNCKFRSLDFLGNF